MRPTRRQLIGTLGALAAGPIHGAVYPAGVSAGDVGRLTRATAFVRGLDDAALKKLVPAQSGLNFVGCANCLSGRQEEQLAWTPERPDEVYCRYCNHRYPSRKYPMEQAVTVRNPRGEEQRYPYWANASGYRYFFEARRDDLVRAYLAGAARSLAMLHAAGGDRQHAARAALLLDRFAEVFPGWCYHNDLPFRQKTIYDGNVPPATFLPNFRTARWTWWAYMDIPRELVQAYDWISQVGVLDPAARHRIEREAANAPAGKALAVDFPGLRVTLFPEAGSRLILGENPSIRHADEDDAKLDQFERPFLLLRHDAKGRRSTFTAVLEPYNSAPSVTSVERMENGLRVRMGGRTDVISWGASPSVSIDGRQVWALAAPKSLSLAAVEADALVLASTPDSPPTPGEVVRLVTADGWVYPFTVVSALGARVQVAEGPGMSYDAATQHLRLTAFPQREHMGLVRVRWP
jgi:hypothetical protein